MASKGSGGSRLDEYGAGKRPIELIKNQVGTWLGKYRGIVTKTNDPGMRGRVKAICKWPFGDVELNWADACMPPGFFFIPKLGDGVWIEFEEGNAIQPIWTGIWYRGGAAPFQFETDDLQPNDQEKPENLSPEDDLQHKNFHDHPDFYSPHTFGIVTPSGHILQWDDWENNPGEKRGFFELRDRNGRTIRIHEQGYIDIVGLKAAGATSAPYIRIDETNGSITIHVADDGDVEPHIFLGGDKDNPGQELVTKKFLTDFYNVHIHSTPTGPSGVPITASPVTPGTDITKKTQSE